MKNSKLSLLVTLLKNMQKHDKMWAYPSQNTMIQKLRQFHHVHIKRRMLCYHLADLHDRRYIRRQKRSHYVEDGNLVLLSTAHCITLKGYMYLVRKGVAGIWPRIAYLRRRYKGVIPELREAAQPVTDQVTPEKEAGYNPYLDPVWRKRHGLKPLFEDLERNGSYD